MSSWPLAKSECVVSGLPVARRVFEILDPALSWEDRTPAGSKVRVMVFRALEDD